MMANQAPAFNAGMNTVAVSAEPKKRKKFIRKVACHVCQDVANDHLHYGGISCYSCRQFFRRYTLKRTINRPCKYNTNQCEIEVKFRTHCPACRYKKCVAAGMRPEFVKSAEMSLHDEAGRRRRCQLGGVTAQLDQGKVRLVVA